MSIQAIVARISELDAALTGRASATGGVSAPSAATGTVPLTATTPAASASFASLLANQSLSGSFGLGAMTGAPAGATPGQRTLAAVQAEVGVAEQPPGSNDAPRIAEYRQATAGSGVGPWCAYFVSWAARQAGTPLGESGQGFGSVAALADWGQRTGRFTPAAGATPSPGDLIVWGGEHIGIVESVDPDGRIHTIEGNSSNAVTRRTHDASGDGATGYVRVG
jgi:hypothetical protein